jgi:aspartate aminotransferase
VVLDCVREAESRISGKQFMEYLPTNGNKDFVKHSIKLAYGEESKAVAAGTIAAIQTLSGTGSCRLMADFMKRFTPDAKVYIPVPTWSNHHNIWKDAGCEERTFRYYKPATRGLDFEGLMEDINGAEEGSVFLLHACAHNPTGVDPTHEQWRQMSAAMKARKLFPFFDMAYQGFASGDCEHDAAALRIFVEDGHKVGCSQSFAKNMGLYGQRIGCFSIMCENADEAARVESQMKLLARAMYSNPPLHGAAIVATILGDATLKKQWYGEVKVMADRIINMRAALRAALEGSGSKLSWNHVTEQIGMFCFSGMTGEQVDKLREEHHIYMTRNGRISMAGVTSGTVGRLASAIHDVTK